VTADGQPPDGRCPLISPHPGRVQLRKDGWLVRRRDSPPPRAEGRTLTRGPRGRRLEYGKLLVPAWPFFLLPMVTFPAQGTDSDPLRKCPGKG
jgi:hypothetical protein